MPSTGIERFIALIGGDANLPPGLPEEPEHDASKPTQNEQPKDSEDAFADLPSVQEAIEMNRAFEKAAKARRPKPQANIQPRSVRNTASPSPHQPGGPDLQSDMRMGDLAPRAIKYSPFLAVTRFCYKFVPQQWSQPLATAFFDANKIYDRPWDIYYVWSGHFRTARPTTFVPEHQLQALINEISHAFPEANINLTDDLCEEGLVLDFDDLPDELRPLCLGRSASREQYNGMVEDVPYPSQPSGKMPAERSLEAFKKKMDEAIEIGKAKSKAKKKADQQVAIHRRHEMNKQVFRAQRYLGLLQKKEEDLIAGLSTFTISPVDPNKAAPHPFELDAIFIAFDVEAYERSPKIITEVGVATLDTRDPRDEAPGPLGKAWHKHIRARHFRVVEYKHLCNHEFVNGCPEDFEFGQSEFVGKDSLGSVLASCFHEPFSKGPLETSAVTEEKRNIILLGHDVNQDIAFLQSIGILIVNRANLVEILDTASMFRSYTRDPSPTSLGKILYHFDIEGWHLHNAGNDAVYTVYAMLAISVKAATERGSDEVNRRHEANAEERTADAIDSAKERAKDETEGWSAEAGGDGGYAMVPKEEDFVSKKEKAKHPVHGPPRPPEPRRGLYTMGGVPLDV